MLMLTMLRRFGFLRSIAGLVLLIVILQVYHFKELSRVEKDTSANSDQEKVDDNKQSGSSKAIQVIINDIITKLQNVHMLDRSGSYGIAPNLYAPLNSENKAEDVTIVTQTTSSHLGDLVLLSDRWNGPISVSVFTYDIDAYYAIAAVAYLCVCFEKIRAHARFHIAFPLSNSPKNADAKDFDINCDMKLRDFLGGGTTNYDIEGLDYPHNMLRNLAIQYSQTSFVLMTDIDMVPSSSLRRGFLSFLHRHGYTSSYTLFSSTVFVVPAFECSGETYPQSRTELLQSWSQGVIRPFYIELCKKCQKYTDYERWKNLDDLDDMEVRYELEWSDPWEPFYIARKDVPLYDERFKQYGFNRISQVCELHIAGYHFAVLNNGFLLHKGFKLPGKFHSKKEREQNRNRFLFRQFKEELKIKYPHSHRRCY